MQGAAWERNVRAEVCLGEESKHRSLSGKGTRKLRPARKREKNI